jgi:hypothetical protein
MFSRWPLGDAATSDTRLSFRRFVVDSQRTSENLCALIGYQKLANHGVHSAEFG